MDKGMKGVFNSLENNIRNTRSSEIVENLSETISSKKALHQRHSTYRCENMDLNIPERDYDLSPLDPNRPTIHALVDDVLIIILKYLPLREIILSEIVCRRWQELLYVMHLSTTHLDLTEVYFFQRSHMDNFSEAMLSKMLLLKGKMLKSLTIYHQARTSMFYSKKMYLMKELFFIIPVHCPNIQHLDLSNVSFLNYDNVKALKDCKDMKIFSANNNSDLREDSFKDLIESLPSLEKLYVSGAYIEGHCFNLLPEGLKELNISSCSRVSKENLDKLVKTCKRLEVLEMEYLYSVVDRDFLEELGVNCRNLKCLKLNIMDEITDDLSNQFKFFTKLTSFKIVSNTFELFNIADELNSLEILDININTEPTNMVDFGKFNKLKNVNLNGSPFRKEELMTLGKCKNLQYVNVRSCQNTNQEIIIKILKGSSEIVHIDCQYCPNILFDNKFITDINEIMKNRSKKIEISINEPNEWPRTKYDAKKINFDLIEVPEYFSEEDFYDDDIDLDLDDEDIGWRFGVHF